MHSPPKGTPFAFSWLTMQEDFGQCGKVVIKAVEEVPPVSIMCQHPFVPLFIKVLL